ncbi:MAG TPA: 2-amino-5-formylamino-6-ribosylaminopyrimidin-4(3H)-one 5'-monophosphate deformylase [Hadesarchaea archaeon]|nr:2-amino-5-formylamino-6-ribosylaminopyrimidin-4(3H)-one 5'-monophosphate deformylase [Hadesarchaea archaeon]
MGSHVERHGAALPLDTDAKIASYVAQEAARRAGAKFLGILKTSYELPRIDTGQHQSLGEVLEELRITLKNAKKMLRIRTVVVVNGHGGNNPVREHLPILEKELGMHLAFNSTIVELEGPHAATVELSMGAAIGITDESKVDEHVDFTKYPEVGFVGLREARRLYPWMEQQAQQVEKEGVAVDKELGAKLLEHAVGEVVNDIRSLQS